MNFRCQKGINLITLSIAIIVLIIITSILVYNAKDSVKVKALNNLYNDIEELNNKVEDYYLKHGEIPKGIKYENNEFITLLDLEESQCNPNNGENYYVINLDALEGVSLNYGRDYSSVKDFTESITTNEYLNLYIINEESHTIYYPQGIEVKEQKYYTEPDKWTKINLSIIITEFSIKGTPVATPPLPNGYYHVGGAVDTGYVISDNVTDENKYSSSDTVGTDLAGNQFVWVPVEQDQKIILKVNCAEDITEMKLYDPFGDEIDLGPVSGKTYENTNITPTVNGGYNLKVTTASGSKMEMLSVKSLYAIDTYNDYWGSDEYINNAANKWYSGSVDDMISDWGYSSLEEYKIRCESRIKDEYSEPTDTINYAERVATNGGFYVGRYEASYSTNGVQSKTSAQTRTSSSTTLTNGMLWNYINQTNALSTAKAYNASLNSSLLTGEAWDRTLGWFVETNNKTITQIAIDSKDWGNYDDDTFSGTTGLINTGAFTQTKANNIYDLAGNVSEWTTEAHNSSSYRVYRGGTCNAAGSGHPASYRHKSAPSNILPYTGFRVTLYL